jgi:hypothetical protein
MTPMAKKKRSPKKDLDAIQRGVKREAQKAAGALDGRFREKVVPDKRRNAARKYGKVVGPEDL